MGFWTYRAYSQIVPGRVSGRNVIGPYADCCEDILELVDESDESWIVDVDTAVQWVSCCFYGRSFQASYAFGGVAMAGCLFGAVFGGDDSLGAMTQAYVQDCDVVELKLR